MSEFNVSNRYATALIELAEDSQNLERVHEDFSLIYNTISASRDLRRLLESPILSKEKKIKALTAIFEGKCSDISLKFIRFIVDKNRENLLGDIARRFLDLMNKKLGRIEISVISAVELTDSQKSELIEKLENITDKKVIPEYFIDESIIGGFKVQVKDTVFDASVQSQLASLKLKLLGEAV